MFGPPKDVEGQCNAHLYIADDYGDNHATCRCQLPKGHEGLHKEEFEREVEPPCDFADIDLDKEIPEPAKGKAIITWELDERVQDG